MYIQHKHHHFQTTLNKLQFLSPSKPKLSTPLFIPLEYNFALRCARVPQVDLAVGFFKTFTPPPPPAPPKLEQFTGKQPLRKVLRVDIYYENPE